MDKTERHMFRQIIPVMLAFFAMGFVDLVGIAANYVKADFGLSDSVANLFPSMVFFWFLVCSVPTGMLMNKIGRRKTVLLSLVVTMAALLLPMIDYGFAVMMVSFSFLGIGNTLMQVSLNPLLSNIVRRERLPSALTFGQFVKALASFSAPLIAGWGALHYGGWRLLFPVFLIESVIAAAALSRDRIREEEITGRASTAAECFSLLRDTTILLCFVGIMCHVGIDVGTNVSAPKLLIEKLGLTLADAGFAASVYFLFRTAGCLIGAVALARCPTKKFFLFSVILMAAAMVGMFVCETKPLLYLSIALVGFGNSNLFSILFSQALLHRPDKKNEVSGLMVMGLFGGTIFPLLMGFASDAAGSQAGAVAVMSAGVLYLFFITGKIRNNAAEAQND